MKKCVSFWALGLALLSLASCSKPEVLDTNGSDQVSAEGRKNSPSAVSTYGGSATALNATITTIENGIVVSDQTLVANTGLLAASGGSLSATEPQANIQEMVIAENLNASISGEANQTVAQSTVGSMNLSVNGNVITVGTVTATASSTCGATSGSSTVTNLVVNGTPITVTGAPNQVVFLQGGGFIMINEQSVSKKGKVQAITVTALRIVIPNAADVRLAAVRTEVKC
jgi:hypothetical protein